MEARRYDTGQGTLSLRLQEARDDAFLFALFRSHAGRAFRAAGVPDAAADPMLAIQHRSASATHRAMFPEAAYWIIENGGEAIGRLIEQDEGDTIYFVDFALLPDRQAVGLGTAFIIAVADEWAAKGKAVRVEVMQTNIHSLKLCAKVGMAPYIDLQNGYIGLRRPVP